MQPITNECRLPVGIQTFSEIRKGGYLYVDKTNLVWKIVNGGYKYNYLSRPRRFGKSLLVDTFQCYLEGRKDLFGGLKIMDLETEWTARPVIRLDMSWAGESLASLNSYLDAVFCEYEKQYGLDSVSTFSFQRRFRDIVDTAHKTSGHRVAVLIDEYDFPLQHSWGTPEHEKCASVYREVFTTLKAADAHIRFVFITGITKFAQISLFSALNNLVNLSFDPKYECLCGISEREMLDNLMPEIEAMAAKNEVTPDEMVARLKDLYDGYHFSSDMTADIYNPFSLLSALSLRRLSNYWVSSGANTLIMKFVDDAEIKLRDFDGCCMSANVLESSDIANGTPELFLYQSGYLTIKDYRNGVYILKFPNAEIRQALYETVLPVLAMRVRTGTASLQGALQLHVEDGNIPEAMAVLKALISDVPYSNKKLACMDMEERYRLIISTILNAIGFQVEVERMLATGRIDMVATSARYIYVIELKLQKNGGLDAAANQIIANNYLAPFQGSARKVVGLALELDDLGKGLTGWREVKAAE